jgi:hypothetical protein
MDKNDWNPTDCEVCGYYHDRRFSRCTITAPIPESVAPPSVRSGEWMGGSTVNGLSALGLQQMVYAWLGFWRNQIPAQAASDLQEGLGPLEHKPPIENCAHKVRKIRRTLCVYFLRFRGRRC